MRKLSPDRALLKQGSSFLAIGLLQLLVDWAIFVALTWLGLAAEPAYVAGRICGAMLGFWLNGRITFAGDDTAVGRRQLIRFVLMWLSTTAIGTWAVGVIDAVVGLKWAWLAKPGIDALLSGAGFLVSRHWVYKR